MVPQFQEENNHKPYPRIANYRLEKTLGKGTFSKVKLGIHEVTGQKVAIKILQKDKIIDVADVERVSRQIHILKLIRHPNIIQLYEIIESSKHLFLVMQYMERGQLFDYIANKKRLPQDEACKIFQQVISGIQYIHKLRIVHRDLKLQNMLMDYDKTIRIVDFGLSNTYKSEQRLKTACGSPCYAAPEMIQSINPYQPIMIDIWSAGVVLYAMVCGYLPFEDDQTPKLYRKILSGEYSLPSHLSPQLQDFLRNILTVDPSKRIRIPEMKQHRWWKKHSNYYYPQGLIVGYHKMPIEPKILNEMASISIDAEMAEKCIQANIHNNETTSYYLLLKKFLKDGNISKADFSAKYFDKSAVQPNKRRLRNHSLKPQDILKGPDTPPRKSKPKSFSKKNPQNQSFLQNSIKIPKKPTRSKSKTRKRDNSKSKLKSKDKTFSKENFVHLENNHHDIGKDKRRNSYSMKNSISRSQSKKKKQLQDISLLEDMYHRPRVRIASTTKNNKKSHQGSYLIGSDTADWPLQPKWNKQSTSKARGAFRRK